MYYIYALAAINLDFSSLSNIAGILVRLLPHVQVLLFYFLVPYIYKSLSEKQAAESAQYALQQKLASANDRIHLLNEANVQTAVYRHDMRHMLIVLEGLLCAGKIQQAQEFIKTSMADLDSFTPKQFCENETVNLLCSYYHGKAQQMGVLFTIKVALPKDIPLADTELCSVVANGLENALLAASQPEVDDKWVKFNCEVRHNKIFLQIKNTYAGNVVIRNGLPVSGRKGHGYGCRSIESIVQTKSVQIDIAQVHITQVETIQIQIREIQIRKIILRHRCGRRIRILRKIRDIYISILIPIQEFIGIEAVFLFKIEVHIEFVLRHCIFPPLRYSRYYFSIVKKKMQDNSTEIRKNADLTYFSINFT
jgi:hypothetical protein